MSPPPGSATLSRSFRAKPCHWHEHPLLILPPERGTLQQTVADDSLQSVSKGGKKLNILSNFSSQAPLRKLRHSQTTKGSMLRGLCELLP